MLAPSGGGSNCSPDSGELGSVSIGSVSRARTRRRRRVPDLFAADPVPEVLHVLGSSRWSESEASVTLAPTLPRRGRRVKSRRYSLDRVPGLTGDVVPRDRHPFAVAAAVPPLRSRLRAPAGDGHVTLGRVRVGRLPGDVHRRHPVGVGVARRDPWCRRR